MKDGTGHLHHEPFITLRDDTVWIERGIIAESDQIAYLVAGLSGMFYNKEGKRTFLMVAATELPRSMEKFLFDTRAEAEKFLQDLPRLRGTWAP